jgi:hypothetical protein
MRASRGDQITGVGAVAIPFAIGAVLAPAHADERAKLFAHYPLQHHAQGGSRQFAEILKDQSADRVVPEWYAPVLSQG